MKKTSVIILVTIIAVSILLGLGYAAIQNVTLNIAGSAEATPNQSNFKVKFMRDPAPTVSDSTHATANITDDLNATINVSGLTGKGQNVTATYSIENASTAAADISFANFAFGFFSGLTISTIVSIAVLNNSEPITNVIDKTIMLHSIKLNLK